MGDWDWTEEELKEQDRKREKYQQERPNDPDVIRGREYQKRHPELFDPKTFKAEALKGEKMVGDVDFDEKTLERIRNSGKKLKATSPAKSNLLPFLPRSK
jgi:hypothetical protein